MSHQHVWMWDVGSDDLSCIHYTNCGARQSIHQKPESGCVLKHHLFGEQSASYQEVLSQYERHKNTPIDEFGCGCDACRAKAVPA